MIVGSDGRVQLSITLTADGPVLRLEGTGLKIQTAGTLALDAEQIALHGRRGVAISSGGDASITVAGDLEARARIHNIVAELGNVNVRANDDVKLNGERVMMNCEYPDGTSQPHALPRRVIPDGSR
jgi:hypothetical protein